MKKSLLLSAAALMAAQGLLASSPVMMQDVQFWGVSPDGKMTASFLGGRCQIIDTETGAALYTYNPSDDGLIAYSFPNGNGISDNGIVLGSTQSNNNACYWKNGMWSTLYEPKPQHLNNSNGITPDGRFICGSIGAAEFGLGETKVPMLVPAVWEVREDGTYGVPTLLPYPETDLTGRVPQYVTALCISDDGNTIIGQVQDYSGMLTMPIIYMKDSEGEWDYNCRVGNELVNPGNIECPEWPGECPNQPNALDYMTEEEQQDYNDAYVQWAAGGYQGDMPEYTDYMTAQEKAAYDAAMAKWQAAYNEWSVKYQAWEEVFYQILDNPNLTLTLFNCAAISPNGKTVVIGAEVMYEDPSSWMGYSTLISPITINVDDMQYKKYPNEDFNPTTILDDGTMVGKSENQNLGQWYANIYLPGAEKPTPLHTYIEANNADLYAWLKEKACHDVEIYDPETGDPKVEKDVWYTGVPYITRDKSMFLLTMPNTYDNEAECESFGYILPMDYDAAGIGAVAIDDNDAPVEYYTIDGVRVENPSARGIYIMRQGNKTLKVMK